jgi:hypothetical protein
MANKEDGVLFAVLLGPFFLMCMFVIIVICCLGFKKPEKQTESADAELAHGTPDEEIATELPDLPRCHVLPPEQAYTPTRIPNLTTAAGREEVGRRYALDVHNTILETRSERHVPPPYEAKEAEEPRRVSRA